MPTFLRRRGPRPVRSLAWLQTTEQSRLRLFFPPENDTRMSCSNAIKSRGSCTASQLRAVVVLRPGGRDPGSLREGQRIARRMPIFSLGGISGTSSPSPPFVRTRLSPSWIVVVSSSTTQTIRSFSCLPHSAPWRVTTWTDWRSSSR